jgi:hypothetical protein
VSAFHIVVDGSNIATEGRSAPSLRQLDDAVRQFQDEFPEAEAVVVVDATFGHRIDPSERKAFEEAVSHGELVSPPAGAIGRGDAFVLRIAERVGGQVLSNDSFQEFHADHPWLFDEGRLIGGKPVPGVGWIFTPRRPVRGPRSRSGPDEPGRPRTPATSGASSGASPRRRRGRSAAVLDAVEAAAAEATLAATTVEPPTEASDEGRGERPSRRARRPRQRGGRRKTAGDPTVVAAIEAAKEEAIGPVASGSGTPANTPKADGATGSPQAVNDPLTFVRFITDHPLGGEVDGVVSNFVSHGAMVDVGDMHCYVPLSGLGSPPPKSARAVLKKGEGRRFTIVRLDPPRRGAQLALAELRDVLGMDLPRPRRRRTTQASAGAKEAKTAQTKPAKTAKASPEAKAAKASKAAKVAQRAKGARPADSAKGSGPAKTGKAGRAAKVAEPAKPAKAPRARAGKATKASSGRAAGSDNVSKTSRARNGPAKSRRTTRTTKPTARQRPDKPHGG